MLSSTRPSSARALCSGFVCEKSFAGSARAVESKGDAISFTPLVLLPRLPPCADLREPRPKGVAAPLERDDASLLCHSLSCASRFCAARKRSETPTPAPITRTKTAMTMPAIPPDEREDVEPMSERIVTGFTVGAAIPLTLLDNAEHSV